MKLPKQWRYWCEKAGLKPHPGCDKRSDISWLYLEGLGFVWRVNRYGMFQRGDLIEEFDRWAICNIDETSCPISEATFLRAVNQLVHLYEKEA